MHAGIDLAGPLGTPVYATADAVVGRSEWANGYGNLIELNHGRGIQTRYGHLSKSLVKPGQRVKRGEQIALMGSTGRSTGSHLHYEVRIDGKAVNPVPFLKSNTYLASIQKRAAALDPAKVAVGGPAEGKK
jgi:murein DD-endopeptidase MepM/ murein hydrolase activator NlpD